jgi:hypothetical protein
MLNNLFFIDDLVELWIKINQRGLKFVFSKFSFVQHQRTVSAFAPQFEHANWWIIPYLNERRNRLISGDSSVPYEQYCVDKHRRNRYG